MMAHKYTEIEREHLFQNGQYSLFYYPKEELLVIQAEKVPQQDQVEEVWLRALELAKEKRFYRWLNDESRVQVMPPKAVEWFQRVWLPKAMKVLKDMEAPKIAMVVSERFYAEMSARTSVQAIQKQSEQAFGKTNLISRYFKDPQEGFDWLVNLPV